MKQNHSGPGHSDVTLSLTTETPDGGRHFRSWTVCECSVLYQRMDAVLGPPANESVATREAVEATGRAVLAIPGSVQHGEGL